jgi:cold shock CspA family protein
VDTAAAREHGDDPNRAGRPVNPYLYGAARKVGPPAPRAATRPLGPVDRHGVVSSGRIVKLLVGQGYGFIRLADDREVYFHRSDVREGGSINEFAVGDHVTFELLEDTVSGARALRVSHRERHR